MHVLEISDDEFETAKRAAAGVIADYLDGGGEAHDFFVFALLFFRDELLAMARSGQTEDAR
jgi:hypothetical protein